MRLLPFRFLRVDVILSPSTRLLPGSVQRAVTLAGGRGLSCVGWGFVLGSKPTLKTCTKREEVQFALKSSETH